MASTAVNGLINFAFTAKKQSVLALMFCRWMYYVRMKVVSAGSKTSCTLNNK